MSDASENKKRRLVTDYERDNALDDARGNAAARQLPPTNTRNVMPKVKPPKIDDKK
ncbi:hypothetical protein M2H12_20350 [Vibrio vulnificus]|nr:hypothetical protein [Vibrio vulnificus]MCU8172630.1 hypothetical protein [Vibrio vulnificus]MCU8479013.1 hypothetical protein [Vibrio vulnificus]HDY7479700.1 hypothetical protein [Vibrio vulnificus]HDY8053245.1 hypothetical protein [Vibrio vulnificus]